MKKSLHQMKVEVAEWEDVKDLPAILGMAEAEFERRMNAPYKWPHYSDGTPVLRRNLNGTTT